MHFQPEINSEAASRCCKRLRKLLNKKGITRDYCSLAKKWQTKQQNKKNLVKYPLQVSLVDLFGIIQVFDSL